jgi:hypothetical protein
MAPRHQRDILDLIGDLHKHYHELWEKSREAAKERLE